MRAIVFGFALFLLKIAFSQNETNIWYFGERAGLDFSKGTPKVLSNGKLSTLEGCATFSNAKSRLLFYTDGMSIWDSLHNIMPNGRGLKGNVSSSQSALIVQKPGSDNIFYVFTVAAAAHPDGFMYSLVDMNLNGGRGDIVSKNIKLTTPCCENMTAAFHSNGKDVWVLTHKFNSDTIYSYLITSLGISNAPVKSVTGVWVSGNLDNSMGQMKISPNGKKLVCANMVYPNSSAFVILGDFNTKTGSIENIWKFKCHFPHSVEFSGESRYLYISELIPNNIVQYHVDVPNKDLFISSRTLLDSNFENNIGTLQLANDGKIYMAEYRRKFLHVIHAPDSSGINCRVQRDYLYLGGRLSLLGLPNFISSFFVKKDFETKRQCVGDSIGFFITDTSQINFVKWDFGDLISGSNNYSTLTSEVYHVFSKAGKYKTKLIYYLPYKKDSILKWISVFDVPKADFSWSTEQTGLQNVTLHLTDNSFHTNSWQWNIEGKLLNGKQVSYNFSDSGKYSVILKTSNEWSCLDTAIQNIKIAFSDNRIYIPNAFSPNGDGLNDLWEVDGKNSLLDLKILNQWGEILYTQKGKVIQWDGKYLDKMVCDSNLVYLIYSKNTIERGHNKFYRGSISILKCRVGKGSFTPSLSQNRT